MRGGRAGYGNLPLMITILDQGTGSKPLMQHSLRDIWKSENIRQNFCFVQRTTALCQYPRSRGSFFPSWKILGKIFLLSNEQRPSVSILVLVALFSLMKNIRQNFCFVQRTTALCQYPRSRGCFFSHEGVGKKALSARLTWKGLALDSTR